MTTARPQAVRCARCDHNMDWHGSGDLVCLCGSKGPFTFMPMGNELQVRMARYDELCRLAEVLR